MKYITTFLILFFLLIISFFVQPRISYQSKFIPEITKFAKTINSINPVDTAYNDLMFLKEILKNK